jgi:hypothetical protein
MASKISIQLKGADRELAKIESEVIELTNKALRISALQAKAELQMRTPVLTGRARGSWNLSPTPNNMRDAKLSVGSAFTILPPPSNKKFDTLYLTNGVPYIQDLNMGNSSQAPARFIEGTVFKYFKPTGVAVNVIP